MSLSSQHAESAGALARIEEILRAEGFEHFGFAELVKPITIDVYEAWLAEGLQGEMDYLDRHLETKREPQRLMKRARSAIVLTLDYLPHPEPMAETGLGRITNAKVAAYARGRDYHHFLSARMKRVCEALKSLYPEEDFAHFTDSGPVLERDLAQRAGLGWVGKNTCLIGKGRGSLFFIAEIYTSLALPVAKITSPDHCGTCTRCLDACPTGALVSPRKLDARKCISYLTIESRETPPVELRPMMGDWLFGCDICQTVCPWNVKAHGPEKLAANKASASDLESDLRYLLTSSNRGLENDFKGTALARSGGVGLKRNALVVAGNRKLSGLTPEIEALVGHPKLGELARWALAAVSASE